MLLQASTIYADDTKADAAETSLSEALATDSSATSVAASTSSGIITGLESDRSYYIMNAATKKLLATRLSTNTDGNAISMRDRYEVTNRQWKLTVVGNSTGILTWVYSPTGKAITVSDGSLALYTNTQAATQKFTIQRINSGNYCGLYKIMYGGKYVAMPSGSSLYPTLTTTFNEYAAWSFMAEDKGYADVFDFNYPAGEIYPQPTDSTLYSDVFLSMAEDWGYWIDVEVDDDDDGNIYIYNYNTNVSARYAYNCMKSDTEIMIYRGHAQPGILSFGDEDGLYNGFLTAPSCNLSFSEPPQGNTTVSAIEALEENALANLRLVIYNGCQTGLTMEGTDYNLVDATFEKGAHYVLGVTEDLNVQWEEAWFYYLISYLNSSYSVDEAVANATDEFSEIVWYFEDTGEYIQQPYPYYAVGDGYQYLSFN